MLRRVSWLLPVLLVAPAAAETPVAIQTIWSVGAQPRLTGWQADRAAQDVTASLWWLDPDLRDAAGPGTAADSVRGAPGWLALAGPGNGTAAMITHHGRAQPQIAINGISLPGQAVLLPALGDADLLLLEGPGDDAAGRVHLDLRRPDGALAGAGEFAAGAFGSRRLLGRLDVPLAKGVALGLAGQWQHDLGWLNNVATGERLNRGQRAGGSALLDLELAPGLSWAVSASYQNSRAGNLPSSACDPLRPSRCDGRFTASLATTGLAQRAELQLYGSRLAWEQGRFSLAVANGLSRQTGQLGPDLPGNGQATRLTLAGQQHRLELALDFNVLRLGVEAGISTERETRLAADSSAGQGLADRRIGQTQVGRHVAARAQWQATGRLELAAGVRLTDADITLELVDRLGCAPCLAAPGFSRQQAQLLTADASAGLAVGEALIFLRSARTARLAGWNLLARTSAELAALPQERGWHHEAGVKADLFGQHLRLNAAAFIDSTRAPVSPLLGLDPTAPVNPGTALMRNQGLDIWASARPLQALELAGSLALQRARWQGAPPPAGPARPLFAPDVSASLQAAWHQPLVGAGATLVPRVGARWRSAMAVAAGPVAGAPAGLAPAGWQITAAVQLAIPDGGWLVSLECENCLDQAMVDGAVAGAAVLNAPRWWQLRFLRRF